MNTVERESNMAKSILEQIFLEGKVVVDQVKDSKQVLKALDKVCKAERALVDTFTERQKTLFKQLDNLYNQLNCSILDNHYITGIKLGLKLGLECNNIDVEKLYNE